MKQLDLFDKEEEEESLTFIQAIKNDPLQVYIIIVALFVFVIFLWKNNS